MNITIHRGTDQIGGCVTEYESNGWRLFVDYGEQLPGTTPSEKPLEIEGLTCGDINRSALLITHYHDDHIGKIAELPPELPIFMGRTAKEISQELSDHLSSVSKAHHRIAERLTSVSTFNPGEQFEFGVFKIMPVVIDHSAFDAYAFRIEADGLSVFHTGDFRTHGFRSSILPQVINKFIGKVDYMVCEATNVNRSDVAALPEYELQRKFQDAFRKNKYNIIYLSSTNIDRLFALYHAALKAGLPFYVDAYQKRIMDIVAGRDRIWGKSRLYQYKAGLEPIVLQYEHGGFRINEKFREFLAERGYVLIARSNDRFDNLIKHIPSKGRKTYLSMWDGYVDKDKPAYNPALAKSLGCDYEYLHTSGHCDMQSIEGIIEMIRPNAIIPIHTDNPEGFAKLLCDKWPILIMHDGETFRPIRDPGYDNITANIYARKPLADNIQVVANPYNQKVWSLDERCLGEFLRKYDALWVLRHIIYAPDRILGYGVEQNEDFAPWDYKVYDADFNLLSSYTEGGHFPNGENWQEKCNYSHGDKAYAIYYAGFNVVISCEIIGPITEEFVRKQYEKYVLMPNTDEEYVEKLWDWHWDTVIIKPLVRIKNEFKELPDFDDVNRIYLFPIESKKSIVTKRKIYE